MFHQVLRKATLAATLVLGMAGVAQAVTLPTTQSFTSCVNGPNDLGPNYDISTKVSGAYDCTISNLDQDFTETDPMAVNVSPGFFVTTTWEFLDRINYTVEPNKSGAYDFSGAIDDLVLGPNEVLDRLMLVFKGGKGTLVGYLVDIAGEGTWSSPFTDPPFDLPGNSSIQDVSHISAYYTTKIAAVPLPAGLPLLLAGLGALALVRRRKA